MKKGEELLNKTMKNDSAHVSSPVSPKKINTTFFIPTDAPIYSNTAKNHTNVRSRNMPHCELSRSIADFYLTELKCHLLRQKHKEHWHYKYEEYYTKKFTELSETLVRYSLSALLGEARHAYEVTFKPKSCDSHRNLTASQRERITKLLKPLYGSLGLYATPCSKSHVLSIYVPESLWLKHLYILQKLFDKDFKWAMSFGGNAWKKGVLYTLALYKQMCLGDRIKMVIAYDTLVNHCHNSGKMLNKFNCYNVDIKNVLNAKKQGRLDELRSLLVELPCNCWKDNTCIRYIGILPLKTNEGYVSTNEENVQKK